MNPITITLESEVLSDKSAALNLVLTQDTSRIVIAVDRHLTAELAAEALKEGLYPCSHANTLARPRITRPLRGYPLRAGQGPSRRAPATNRPAGAAAVGPDACGFGLGKPDKRVMSSRRAGCKGSGPVRRVFVGGYLLTPVVDGGRRKPYDDTVFRSGL
ncbi:MAG: hypothetical protein WCK89_07660 [bacterium]